MNSCQPDTVPIGSGLKTHPLLLLRAYAKLVTPRGWDRRLLLKMLVHATNDIMTSSSNAGPAVASGPSGLFNSDDEDDDWNF